MSRRVASVAVLLIALFLAAGVGVIYAAGSNIDVANKWAWGGNTGWLNFNPAYGGVTVYDDHLEGYAWAENIGWVRLGTHTGGGKHTYANTAADDYGVNNDGNGNLSGYAWSTNAGWLNFNPTHGQVTIDPATGEFDGYAWGENVGWIHFKNASTAYKIVTVWRGGATPASNLSISKMAAGAGGTANLPLSGVITYTITLSNSGGGAVTGVVMTDPLPSRVGFGGWVAQSNAQEAGNAVSWTGVVSGGDEIQVVFTVTVGSGSALRGQTITNTAYFSSSNAGSASATAVFKVADESAPDHKIYLPVMLK